MKKLMLVLALTGCANAQPHEVSSKPPFCVRFLHDSKKVMCVPEPSPVLRNALVFCANAEPGKVNSKRVEKCIDTQLAKRP